MMTMFWRGKLKIDSRRKILQSNLVIASILAIIVSLIMLRYFYGVDIRVLGNDAMAHTYKVWLLSNQIRNLSWPYWGLWDFNWYCGYPFLQLYAPLFYFLSAFSSLFFSLSPFNAVKFVSFVSYPLSAFTMYFCSLQITNNKVASVISSLSYAAVPAFIADLVVAGNPTMLLGFFLFPLLFLLVERLITYKGAMGVNFSIASIVLALTVLSAYRLGLVYTLSVFFYMALNYVTFKRKFSITSFLIFPTGILLSAFFLVPALFYGMTIANISWSAAEPPSTFLFWFAVFLAPVHHSSLGVPLFAFGLLLPAFAALKRQRRTNISLNEKKLQIFVLCAIVLFMLTFGFVIPFYGYIPIINNVLLGSTLPALSFFSAILCGLYLSSHNSHFVIGRKSTRKQKAVIFVIILILLQGANVYVYHPVSPNRYMKAYEYIQNNDDGWFRVFQVPRQPSSSSISMFVDVQVLDGWFDQGATKGLEFFILKMMGFAEAKARPYGWGDFYASPSKALSALRILGVKYVIVDSSDPVFPSDVSKTIFLNLNTSDLVERVAGPFEPSEHIYLFRMKEWFPIIATDFAFVINSEDELATFYDIVSNRTFDPRSGVFISNNDVSHEIPWKNWTGNFSIVAQPVNLTIHQLEVYDLTFQINFEVDRSSFLYIPISRFPNLKVTLNEVETKVFRALPDFLTVYLPSKGSYHLRVSRVITSFEATALFLSSIALAMVMLTGIISGINYHRRKRPVGHNIVN